ncbi:MAG: hypothetical protein ACFFBD_08105 [Candidatus Hodarchaeota archaeon]
MARFSLICEFLGRLDLDNNPLLGSLAGMITLLGLSQRNEIFKNISDKLFDHPLVQLFDPKSLTCLINEFCPLCGSLGPVT